MPAAHEAPPTAADGYGYLAEPVAAGGCFLPELAGSPDD